MAHAMEQTTAEQPGALIVGASSGIGAALARRLAADGYRLALVARREEQLDALAREINVASPDAPLARVYPHDVRDYDTAPDLFARIATDLAPLRLVIYAAGTMPRVTSGTSFEDERAMVETNVIGAMRWLGLAAEAFERAGEGTLVGISSVAGERGRPGNGAYMASKAALTTYLDSLRFRLAPKRSSGVRVVTIKPGYVDTAMVAGLRLPKPLTVSPDTAAVAITRAVERGKAVAYVPGYWAPILWLVRHLPARIVARMPS